MADPTEQLVVSITHEEEIPRATHGSKDRPLRIGGMEIPCYVLPGDRRVLYQRAMVAALGMKYGGNRNRGGDRLANFTAGKALEPYVSPELLRATTSPIKFRTPKGALAYGYDATILVDICEAVLQARVEGKLQAQQEHIAKQCEILVRGFARVGIIALVDEATGYQEVRKRDALEKYLSKYISKELVRWSKMFPDDFYEQMYRLRGWDYKEDSSQRPGIVGHYTLDLVYDRLAPLVVDELKRLTPKDEKGRRKNKLFQRLTDDIGHNALRSHLFAVITLMKASPNWNSFYRLLQRALPKHTETVRQLEMELEANPDYE
jgi:hypothetical protein